MPKQSRQFVSLTHREAMIRHAIKRLWQRKGIVLSNPEYHELAQRIRAKAQEPVAIHHRGITAYAVWNASMDCICTFYPSAEWAKEARTQ